MAETVTRDADGNVTGWGWASIMQDLKRQGGLDGVIVDPTSIKPGHCGGETAEGIRFFITWSYNENLLLSMAKDDAKLVEAFAKVVEYQPFCKYLVEGTIPTYEWDAKNPDMRMDELVAIGSVGLERLC